MFSETLKKIRQEKWLTQEKLAQILKKRVIQISAIETGRTRISIEMATDIEKALGLKDDKLTQAWLKDRRTSRLKELTKTAGVLIIATALAAILESAGLPIRYITELFWIPIILIYYDIHLPLLKNSLSTPKETLC